jgi:uncharacterized membrane protein SpoIIM required for sporulation
MHNINIFPFSSCIVTLGMSEIYVMDLVGEMLGAVAGVLHGTKLVSNPHTHPLVF